MNTFQILDELLKEHHLNHGGSIKWCPDHPNCSHTYKSCFGLLGAFFTRITLFLMFFPEHLHQELN